MRFSVAEKLVSSSLQSQFKCLVDHGVEIKNRKRQVLYLVILNFAHMAEIPKKFCCIVI